MSLREDLIDLWRDDPVDVAFIFMMLLLGASVFLIMLMVLALVVGDVFNIGECVPQ